MYGSNQNSFQDLMNMAKQNADDAKRKSNHSLNCDNRPRRADPKQAKLKQGVAVFLAKQQEEEKRKAQEEILKKEKLLQLRNQDRKAANRVRKMLSMTKSANKSCVADAKECLNQSVAAQGEIQPDEDDYGYTSNYADMMHKKMMEKYKSIPITPAFPQSRVPVPKHHSLQKNGTGWKKSQNDYNGDSSPDQYYDEPIPAAPSKKSEKFQKAPKKGPSPPDYRQLLLLAEEKSKDPLPVAKLLPEKKMEREEFEFGRPMTAKQKSAFLAEKELKDRVARRMDLSDTNNNSAPTDNRTKPSASFKIPKANKSKDEESVPAKKSRFSEPEPKFARDSPQSRPSERYSGSDRNGGQVRSTSGDRSGGGGAPILKSSLTSDRQNGSFKSSGNPGSSNSLSQRPTEKSLKPASSEQHPKSRESFRPSPQYRSQNSPQSNHDRDRPRPSPSLSSERDQNRRMVQSQLNFKQKPGPSRESLKERVTDTRENSRNGMMASMKSKQQQREPERRPMSKDQVPESRRDGMPPSQRKGMPPPSKRDNMGMSKGNNMSQASGRREMQSNQRGEQDMPPSQRKEMQPPQRREMQPPQRKEMQPPQRREMQQPQRREMQPPQRREAQPPPQRREMQQPQRRDREMSMKQAPSRFRDEQPRFKPKARAVIDSDDEYDSEMDDFIDDSEVDVGDISAEIGRIFNYDRRRFNYNEESDDECMESSVAQQMFEERRSLQIGIKEDLEDIAKEEAEKRMRKMKMQGMKRK